MLQGKLLETYGEFEKGRLRTSVSSQFLTSFRVLLIAMLFSACSPREHPSSFRSALLAEHATSLEACNGHGVLLDETGSCYCAPGFDGSACFARVLGDISFSVLARELSEGDVARWSIGERKAALELAAASGLVGASSLLLPSVTPEYWKDDSTSPLLWSILMDDSTLTEMLLKAGHALPPRCEFEDCHDPLTLAIRYNRIAVFRLLTKHYSLQKPDARAGETLLHKAARSGIVGPILDALIESVPVDALDTSGRTPLCLAARAGHVGTMSVLLEQGASPDGPAGAAGNPAACAAEGGQGPVKLILEAGGHLRYTSSDNILRLAFSGALTEIQRLIHSAPPSEQPQHLAIALQGSAGRSDLPMFRALCQESYAVDVLQSVGPDILLGAALAQNADIAQFAIAKGATPGSVCTEQGSTSLMQLAEFGNVRMLSMYISAGARVDDKGENGRNALHVASSLEDRAEVLETLLAHGANVNAPAALGWTPLSIAVANNLVENAGVLLKHGADVHRKDPNGSTPAEAAAASDNPRMRMLFEGSARRIRPRYVPPQEGSKRKRL